LVYVFVIKICGLLKIFVHNNHIKATISLPIKKKIKATISLI
jgi:hypothetical protein